MSPQLLPKDTSPGAMLSMLAGHEKTSRGDSESQARKAASGKMAERDKMPPPISLPHKGAIFRYDPPVFD
jgi:hypothetical protein